MTHTIGFFVLMLIAAMTPGCGTKGVIGGTKGLLHTGSAMMSELQITVHQVEGSATKQIGSGVTDSNGEFELVTNGAKGPLKLSPGEYRFTLESVGAPVVLPQEFTQADTTPLKLTWSAGDKAIDFDLPVFKTSR